MERHLMIRALLFSLIILTFFVGEVLAVPVGRVTHIEGRADVLKAGQKTAKTISLGQAVDEGDILRTKSKSKAEITFLNKNVLRIAASTRVIIKQYLVQGEDSAGVMVLERGMAQVISSIMFIKRLVASPKQNKLEVNTDNGVCGLRGSNMIVSYRGGVTSVLFIAGKGYAYNPAKPEVLVSITAGNISFIERKETPTHPRKLSDVELNVMLKAVIPSENLEKDIKRSQEGTLPSVSGASSSQSGAPPGEGGTPPGQGGTPPGQGGTPPGQSGSAPGQSGSAPGQSGSAPGQSGSAPGQSGTSPGQSGTSPGLSGTSPGQSGTSPGLSGTSPGQSGTSPGLSGTSPGLSGTPPGQGGTPPGQGGSPPGQSGSAPGQSGTSPGQQKGKSR